MINLDGKRVSKLMIGNVVIYEAADPRTTWLELKNDSDGVTSFKGQLLMNYDENTGTAIMKGSRFVTTKTDLKKSLFFELPNGYAFDLSRCDKTISMFSSSDGVNRMKYVEELTYLGNRCYVNATSINNVSTVVSPWFPMDSFNSSMTFYLTKE